MQLGIGVRDVCVGPMGRHLCEWAVKLVRWPTGTGTAEKYIAGTVAKKGTGTAGMVKLVRWPTGTGTAEKYIAGTVAPQKKKKGDGYSGYGKAGTVANGDRDSERVYSWDSAEGLEQRARVFWIYWRRMQHGG